MLSIATLMTVIGAYSKLEAIGTPGLFFYLFFAPVWALWLGIDLLRKPVQIEAA